MIHMIFDNLRSIHCSTALLEILDWDEESVDLITKQLTEYFEKNHDKDPEAIKKDLSMLFDKRVCKVIFEYINYLSKRIEQTKGQIDYEA